jgi:hypothetical protein
MIPSVFSASLLTPVPVLLIRSSGRASDEGRPRLSRRLPKVKEIAAAMTYDDLGRRTILVHLQEAAIEGMAGPRRPSEGWPSPGEGSQAPQDPGCVARDAAVAAFLL